MAWIFNELSIKKVVEITPHFVSDDRGGIVKEYDRGVFLSNGIDFIPLESTVVFSKKNVIRGLHFQKVQEQDRVVRCVSGNVWAVVVDLRQKSKTCGVWLEVDINNGKEVYIPVGCAFGTLALSDSNILCMYGKNNYKSEYATGLVWNDDFLSIQWPIKKIEGEFIISEKDRNLMNYEQFKLNCK